MRYIGPRRDMILALSTTMLLLGAVLTGGWLLSSARDAEAPVAARATASYSAQVVPSSVPTLMPTIPPTPPPTGTAAPTAAVPTSTPTLERSIPATQTGQALPAEDQTAPTQQEADQVVRAFFAAVEADSYEDARALTSGEATRQTDEVRTEVQREADANGVTIDLRVPEIATAPGAAQREERPVQVDYVIEAYADSFLGVFKAREERLSNVFRVARLPEGVRIVRIDGDLLPPVPDGTATPT